MDMRLTSERRLVMTFALRQALQLLQMPQLELAQWLQSEIDRNPLLEQDGYGTQRQVDIERAAIPTLHEHLLLQIRENFSSHTDKKRAIALVELLDERGFLIGPIAEADIPVLSVLQTFSPAGIFARNVQESLLLQLIAKGKKNALAYELVQNCFEDLLQGRYESIKKKLKLADLNGAINELAHLSLHPANSFKQDPVSIAAPDLLIEKIEGGWTLELIEDELPKFHIRTDYLELELETAEEKELMRGFHTQAKWIFRSLGRRRKLLREIGRILVRRQSAYLNEKGPLTAISMKDLAEKLQLHESTISRALSGKYISTPRGTFLLKELLCSIPAAETAREILEKLIQSEDKENPLTDDELSNELKKKGFPVARRTISKYRTQLKIGSATQRKHTAPKKLFSNRF